LKGDAPQKSYVAIKLGSGNMKDQPKNVFRARISKLFPFLQACRDALIDLCDDFCVGFYSTDCKDNPERKKCSSSIILNDLITLMKHCEQQKKQRDLT
jgi:hypothetical protein